MKVFLSHKAEDVGIASSVSARLKDSGSDVYLDVIDPDTSTADDLTQHIRGRLGECSDLMAVISNRTQASWWVPWEIGVATEKDYPLATFAADNCAVPEYLRKWPYLRNMSDVDLYVRVRKQADQTINERYSYKSAPERRPLFVKQFHASLKAALGQ